jgi:hypothetical protein
VSDVKLRGLAESGGSEARHEALAELQLLKACRHASSDAFQGPLLRLEYVETGPLNPGEYSGEKMISESAYSRKFWKEVTWSAVTTEYQVSRYSVGKDMSVLTRLLAYRNL